MSTSEQANELLNLIADIKTARKELNAAIAKRDAAEEEIQELEEDLEVSEASLDALIESIKS